MLMKENLEILSARKVNPISYFKLITIMPYHAVMQERDGKSEILF